MTAPIAAAIELIDEQAWSVLEDYPETGEAQIAETTTVDGERLIVRRVRLTGAQAQLFPNWRHYAALSNRTEALSIVEAGHRDHANIELEIRDLLDQALAHAPSGPVQRLRRLDGDRRDRAQPPALDRTLGLPDSTPRRAHTNPSRLLAMPGRLTYHARQITLHLPARWPWKTDWLAALAKIRALPVLT